MKQAIYLVIRKRVNELSRMVLNKGHFGMFYCPEGAENLAQGFNPGNHQAVDSP